MDQYKIHPQPEWDAFHDYWADNDVHPPRTIAERIANHYCSDPLVIGPLVDAISIAIEDAMEHGMKLGPLIPPPQS